MNIKTIVVSLVFLFVMDAHADDENKANLSALESEIYSAAQSNGLDQSNINIHWNSSSSGGYTAAIRCINSEKCNKSEISLSFSKKEVESTNGSQLQSQLLRAKIKSLLNSKVRE